MPAQKLYAGAKLREVRTRIGLTQKDFAAKLGVSLPYLNQMENNNRPVSTTVVLGLAQEFGLDVTELGSGDTERLVSDMREAIADPVFADTAPPLSDLRLAASNAPALARAFLDLHRAYRQTHERLASLDEALGQDGSAAAAPIPVGGGARLLPLLRQLHRRRRPRRRALRRPGRGRSRRPYRSRARLGAASRSPAAGAGVRHYDRATRTLTLSPRAAPETQRFQLLHQFALLAQDQLLEATLDLARFQTDDRARDRRIGMANYFAGAVLMPYTRFAEAARDTRHDLEQLSIQFGASIEQVAHRLSTLQRPGAKGVPFFFVRVDQAGTVTKRHSATRLQFARYGGACPLVERAPRLRDAGPLPAPAGRNARRRALRDPRPRRVEIRRRLGHAHPPLRHLAGLRGHPRPATGLCRRARPRPRRVVPAHRHLLPHLRTRALPPARRAAARTPPARVNPDHRGTLPYDIAD
jgi:transcriptional regulator with XRE-family HTH domain